MARREAKTSIHVYLFRLFEKAVSVNFRGADLTTQLNTQVPAGVSYPIKPIKNGINRVITLIRQICSFGRVKKPCTGMAGRNIEYLRLGTPYGGIRNIELRSKKAPLRGLLISRTVKPAAKMPDV